MPAKLQFAFQGGGARLALLLPVVQAIRECETENIIEVTRVAGTSAGAIAAALVAEAADIKSLVTYLSTIAEHNPKKILKAFPRIGANPLSKATAVIKLISNITLASEAAYIAFLEECLKKARVKSSKLTGELRIPCTIICADISSRGVLNISPNATLIQTLANSTALPFVFRNSGHIMDGGLVDNLPIDYLSTKPEDGIRLAVGFDEDPYVAPTAGFFSLASTLLDASITSKTRATKRTLGSPFVLSLSADAGDNIVVNSFDVDGFIRFLASESAFTQRVQLAKDWIIRHAKEIESAARGTRTPKALSEPDEAIKQLKTTFQNIEKISSSYHKHDNIITLESSFEVIAHSLVDKTKYDVVRCKDRIIVTSGSLNIYVLQLFSSNSPHDATSTRIEVLDKDMKHVDFALLEAPQPGQLAKSTTIVFTKPLKATGSEDDVITIFQEQHTFDFMAPLREKGADYLTSHVTQPTLARKVQLALAVPKEFSQLSLDDGTAERLRTLTEPIDAEDLAAPVKPGVAIKKIIEGAPSDFVTYAWQALDVERGHQARVLFRALRA